MANEPSPDRQVEVSTDPGYRYEGVKTVDEHGVTMSQAEADELRVETRSLGAGVAPKLHYRSVKAEQKDGEE